MGPRRHAEPTAAWIGFLNPKESDITSASPTPDLPAPPDPVVDTGAPPAPAAPPPAKPRRTRWLWVAITLLALAVIGTGIYLYLTILDLERATTLIEKQERELEEQRDLIDRKETFGAAMQGLVDTAAQFDGALLGTLVSYDDFDVIASRAWSHRWDATALDRDITDAEDATHELELILATAATEAASNTTGSAYETVIDSLGGGHVVSLLEAADEYCESDVIACVGSEDPQTVHFDTGDNALPYMTDWLRTGIAYHEFAHVLQFTNPEQTVTALEAFGGDDEIMADCYALTYLDGWSLDHRVYISRYEWWDVSLGYGHTCDESQRQAIRDWYGSLGVTPREVSQER